ncbi:MAG: SRPBCC family protein [Thermoanaerobaculia bacterium]
MFRKIVTVVVVLVAALLIFAATKPDTLRVERTASIKAPPEKIFPLVNDFHNWSSWSPWEKRDPAMKRTYSGAAVGKGAVYEWDGNNQVGKGRMEITDTTAPSRITIKLDFMEPLEGHDIAEYTLEPQGDSTKVTWVMHGPNRFIGKVISVFISMDKMIGKDFETGLANLKIMAEK